MFLTLFFLCYSGISPDPLWYTLQNSYKRVAAWQPYSQMSSISLFALVCVYSSTSSIKLNEMCRRKCINK